MKFCRLCGETYRDHVDFCFVDGEVLADRAPRVAPDPLHLEAPDPALLDVTPDRAPRGPALPPTRSATPIPRSRRSLLQRAATPTPPRPTSHTAAEERMTPTPVMHPRHDEPAPEPLTPAPVQGRRAPEPAAGEPWGALPPPEGAEPWAEAWDPDLAEQPGLSWQAVAGALLVLAGLATLAVGIVGLFGEGDVPEAPPRQMVRPGQVSVEPPSAARRVEEPVEAPGAPEAPAARTAPVRFVTTPPGATVFVAGRAKGRTPLKIDLPLGDHAIRVELEGHDPLVREIEVSPGENLVPTWTLLPSAPAAAALVPVVVQVAGREGDALSVDGEPAGPIPAQLSLAEGVHVFEVSGPGGAFRVRRDVRANADGEPLILQLGR